MSLIKLENEVALLEPEVSSNIAYFETMIKYAKEQEEMLKKTILDEMEAKGILKIDTPELTITYVGATDRETFDSKGFQADYPNLYDEYVLIKGVKPSIRIKIK